VGQSRPEARALHVTATWSAKEAVLKALRVGLRVDTRRVCCRVEPMEAPPNGWARFGVVLAPDDWPGQVPALTGWWRAMDHYVLAVAASDGPGPAAGVEQGA
jgi:4'-phosphopantetheinyl transferase